MEYLGNGDLDTYLRSRPPLRESECGQITSQVAKGLELMHKAGFAHRDIKPQVRKASVDDNASTCT